MRLGFLAILLALVGCADDYASVFITGVSTPTASDGACTYDTSTQLLSGRYDYSAGTSYELALSVENSLFARENGLHAETNGVFVTDAVVNMISTATSASVGEYRVPASGYIAPGGTDTVTVEAIPGGMVTTEGQLILEISLIGHTQGEIDIETGAFSWPVSVCNGCLFACVSPDDLNEDSLGQCAPGSNYVLESVCP